MNVLRQGSNFIVKVTENSGREAVVYIVFWER